MALALLSVLALLVFALHPTALRYLGNGPHAVVLNLIADPTLPCPTPFLLRSAAYYLPQHCSSFHANSTYALLMCASVAPHSRGFFRPALDDAPFTSPDTHPHASCTFTLYGRDFTPRPHACSFIFYTIRLPLCSLLALWSSYALAAPSWLLCPVALPLHSRPIAGFAGCATTAPQLSLFSLPLFSALFSGPISVA